MLIKYLSDSSIKFLHVSTKHGPKLAEKFFMPAVVFQIYFRLHLQGIKRRSKTVVQELVESVEDLYA